MERSLTLAAQCPSTPAGPDSFLDVRVDDERHHDIEPEDAEPTIDLFFHFTSSCTAGGGGFRLKPHIEVRFK